PWLKYGPPSSSVAVPSHCTNTVVCHGQRHALLDALAESGWARLGAEVRAAVQRAGTDYEARLRAAGRAYVRFATRDAALLELMFSDRQGRQAAALQEAAAGAFSALVEIVQEGQASGVVDPGDPERMALLLFAT